MKKKFYLLPITVVIGITMLTAFGGDGNHNNNSDYPSGSPAANTGSPGDGKHCSHSGCHNGSATTQAGIITSNIPGTGYTPGASYTITVALTGSGNKGFEVSPQNATGTLLGTLTAGSGSKLVGSGKYVTQNSAVGGSSATWNFTWTAPSAGTGTVTFYGAFAITKNVTKLSTLVVDEASPLAVTATATPGTICAGQSSQLNVVASGGSGTFTYSWTSIPAGYTSGIQNPVVTPTEFTQYIVAVSDGTLSGSDTTQVMVTAPPTVVAGNDTTCCVNVTGIPLHGTATGSSSVLWTTSGDGTFSNATGLTGLYYPGPGDKAALTVHLTLTASPQAPCANAISGTRIILFDPCGVGIQDRSHAFSFSLRPNPSNGIFNIYSEGTMNGDVVIRVMDLNGRMLVSESTTVTGTTLNHRMDLSALGKGVYFVRIETGADVKTEKLILQ
jgi:hypothetical protein